MVRGSPWAEAKSTLRGLFTKTRSSSPFCRARWRYIPTLLLHGRIANLLQEFPPGFLLPPSLLRAFTKMAASSLPACVLKGASGRLLQVSPRGFQPLYCIDYSGDGGQAVWLEPGGSSPADSWCEPNGDATHPGPYSAFRYLGNERWGRQGLARARRAPACWWREGRGFVGVWGPGSGGEGRRLACGVGGQGSQFL